MSAPPETPNEISQRRTSSAMGELPLDYLYKNSFVCVDTNPRSVLNSETQPHQI